MQLDQVRRIRTKSIGVTFGAALLCITCGVTTFAQEENPMTKNDEQALQKGIEYYKAGAYRQAMGQFGMAMPREFHNAVLHYYMANTLINMKQKDSAIREFRIAYAIAPKEQAGQLSKLALSYLGADNFNDADVKAQKKVAPKGEKNTAVDPIFVKTLELLKQLSEPGSSPSPTESAAERESIRIEEGLKKSRAAVSDSLLRYNPDELDVPADVHYHLHEIRRLTEEKRRRPAVPVAAKKDDNIKQTAESLQKLLNEKNSSNTKTAPRTGRQAAQRTAPRTTPQATPQVPATPKTNPYIQNFND